ncbi:MAG TPA: dihydrolipoamide succinyltransferase, partial [Parvularcula sp.]|nr:dihydrolipoamide succinyltransferase [Parvularcula sp.]
MPTKIRVPTLGESVTEATVGRWLKNVGDAVKADEPLVELETDKVSVEVPAPSAGVLSEITAKAGDTVGLDAVLGKIGEGNGAAKPAAKTEQPAAKAEAAKHAIAMKTEAPLSPAPRRVVAETGLDPASIKGTGKDGRVTKGDALAAASAPQARAPEAPRAPRETGAREERVKMTRLRQTIARRLKEAQETAAMLTTFNDVDMTAVMALRGQYKDLFEKKHGVKLGFMS